MTSLEQALQVYLLVYGAGLAVHYFLMAAAADQAPIYMRVAYVVASVGGFAAVVFAATPGALAWALVSAAVGGGGALVVALTLWAQGIKVCEVMNHAEAIKAAKSMLNVVHQAQQRAVKDAQWLTPSTRDHLWELEDRERMRR